MRKLFIASVLLLSSLRSSAQNETIAEKGCGTITTESEMKAIEAFLAKNVASKTTIGNDTIPLSIHIVGKDNGTGYYKLDNLFTVICQLNTMYAPVGFYFSIQWPINFINNSNFYAHDSWEGYQMMATHNISNTINVYFVDNPSGACGYFSPSGDALAIKKNCANPNSTTLTHEIGHYFGLPHTFYGWENGYIPPNPEKVTRGAGANCSSAGDMFCDTDADYLSDRWYCPYTGVKLDPNGTPIHPDSSLYMSYATDGCMSRFSNQQMARMQYSLHNDRPYLLQGSTPVHSSMDFVSIIYPTDSLYANNTNLKWHKVKGADYYHVKITHQSGSSIMQEAITSDTLLAVTFAMLNGVGYKVSIIPLSSKNVCREKVKTFAFNYSALSSPLNVNSFDKEAGTIALYPNPASQTATIDLASVSPGNYQVQVSNINGQKLFETAVNHTGGSRTISVPVASFSNGVYIVRMTGNNSNWTEKLIIQK